MPPWLVAILKQNKSLGLVDTLAMLTGTMPTMQQVPTIVRNGEYQAAKTYMDAKTMLPMMDLSDSVTHNYGQPLPKGYRGSGYKSADPNVTFGDAVLGHEFGHLAGGMMFDHMADFEKAFAQPDRDEGFADAFQNAVQFLRAGTVNSDALDKKSKIIMESLLKHPVYQNHPINTTRGVQGFLQGVMKQ